MSITNVISAAGPIASGLFGLIDSLFTTEDERMQAKLKLLELEKSGELAQLSVNREEAKHTSLFVAGWRPFIGWVCGLSFAWTFLAYPILQLMIVVSGLPIPLAALPVLDISQMMPVLLGMLGLGAMRSYERSNGVERNSWDVTPRSTDGVDRRANS